MKQVTTFWYRNPDVCPLYGLVSLYSKLQLPWL